MECAVVKYQFVGIADTDFAYAKCAVSCILHCDRHFLYRCAEHFAQVDGIFLECCRCLQLFAVDNCVEAHKCVCGIRVVGHDGKVVECGAGIERSIGANGSYYFNRFARIDDSVGYVQAAYERCLRCLKLHCRAGSKVVESLVLVSWLFGAPVIALVGARHGHFVGYIQVVDTAEQSYTLLEYIVGCIVVVVYLDVAVARQGDVETYRCGIVAIYGSKYVDKFHHKLAVDLGIFNA